MKYRPILVDNTLQELTQHGTDEFPVSVDEQRASDAGCFNIDHWHYEIQIVLVTKGSMTFECPAGLFNLHEGQGIFINSGVLHKVSSTDCSDSTYLSLNFKPEYVSGGRNCILYEDYVEPIIVSGSLSSLVLGKEEWHRDVLHDLQEISDLINEKSYGYELNVKADLCRIWFRILSHNRDHTERVSGVSFQSRQRIRTLKTFIHQHYMDHISLTDIANAGHISRSECCRVFQRAENISPITYLKDYRISQSAKMLTSTDLSIQEIAYQSGFGSASYFTDCFRRDMKCTPREYRTRYVTGIAASEENDLQEEE